MGVPEGAVSTDLQMCHQEWQRQLGHSPLCAQFTTRMLDVALVPPSHFCLSVPAPQGLVFNFQPNELQQRQVHSLAPRKE